MVERKIGPGFLDMDRACTSCQHKADWRKSAPRLYADKDDNVRASMYCSTCENYVLTTFHHSGAYAPRTEWISRELRCRQCDSLNVRPWSKDEPCPSCGGNLEARTGVGRFVD
jgi:hypothetical protein